MARTRTDGWTGTGGRNLVEELFFIISFLFFPSFFLGLGQGGKGDLGTGRGWDTNGVYQLSSRLLTAREWGFSVGSGSVSFADSHITYIHFFLCLIISSISLLTLGIIGVCFNGKAGVCCFSMSSFHFIFSFFSGRSIWGLNAALISCYYFFSCASIFSFEYHRFFYFISGLFYWGITVTFTLA